MSICDYIVPVIILALIIYSILKKKAPYSCFVDGAKQSTKLVFDTLPYIIAIFIMIELFSASHLEDYLIDFLGPTFGVFGIPKEVVGLVIIKLFSGSGGLAYLEHILSTYGVDSLIGISASLIAGSSEAVFFVTSVYFAKSKVTKYRYIIFVCIILNLLNAILACQIARWIV